METYAIVELSQEEFDLIFDFVAEQRVDSNLGDLYKRLLDAQLEAEDDED